MNEALINMVRKSIAVSSGKGGVGKTTTAVNLALYFARLKVKVCLIDVDPLSDITTLLDIKEPLHIIQENIATNPDVRLNDYLCRVFRNLDILFPQSKLGKEDSALVFNLIYNDFTRELVEKYDLFIFDMPAGIRKEDNIDFLPFMSRLILVTNAEPSAHMSAGGYLRIARELCPELPVYFWHNKFDKNPGSAFNPDDVIGNYNKYSPEELQIPPETVKDIMNLAYIPKDPSMDLLQSNPSVTLNIQRSMIDQLIFLKEERIKALGKECHIPPNTMELVKFYLASSDTEEEIKDFMVGLGRYVFNFLNNRAGEIPGDKSVFTEKELNSFHKLYESMKKDKVLKKVKELTAILNESVTARENEKRLFFVGNVAIPNKLVDQKIRDLLILLNETSGAHSFIIKNISGLLLFYFSLYKLFQSPSMLKAINNFIPTRQSSSGHEIRDKRKQIRYLIENNELYRKKYFTLIKKLFPVVSKQISVIVSAFKLNKLYLQDRKGQVRKDAYIKLFSHFIHDTVNSGLGVITSFNYRPSARAFYDAAEKLYRELHKPIKGRTIRRKRKKLSSTGQPG